MSQNENIRIYVISHSEEDIKKIKEDEIYIPLFVGRNGKDNLGFLSDDSFKGNISSKNKDYCELTGLYWMWKESDADIIGLCHYRRYFKGKDGKRLEKKAIIEDLSNHDIIVSKKSKLIKGTYWETFKGNYFSDALKITREIINVVTIKLVDGNCPSITKVLNWAMIPYTGFNSIYPLIG